MKHFNYSKGSWKNTFLERINAWSLKVFGAGASLSFKSIFPPMFESILKSQCGLLCLKIIKSNLVIEIWLKYRLQAEQCARCPHEARGSEHTST